MAIHGIVAHSWREITLFDDDKYIGRCSLHTANDSSACVGIGLVPAYQNKGFGFLMGKKLIRLAKHSGLTKLIWYTGSTNIGSQKLAKKLGFLPATGPIEGLVYFEMQLK